jgi:hypothetical protein
MLDQRAYRSRVKTYVVNGLLIEVLGGDGGLDDFLVNLLSQILGADILRMLSGDNNSVNTLGDDGTVVVLVLNSDLGLGVGAEPREGAIAAGSSHSGVELVGKHNSEGEKLGSLVGGITEHDSLVSSTELLQSGIIVETLSDIGGLLLNGDQDVAGLVVEALRGVIVTDVLDGATDDLLVVKAGLGGDFTEDHDHTGLGGSLTSDLK